MQKMKNAILFKLIENRVTDAELKVFLEILRRQSDRGSVTGVYYKSTREKAGFKSDQTFYNAMRGLEEKQLIQYRKGSYFDLDVLVLNNDFRNQEEANREGYLHVGKPFFQCSAFRKLKVNEKLLAMYFFMVCGSGKRSFHCGVENFYDKFTKMFRVEMRAMQGYLHSLRSLFSIGVKDGQYWITPLKSGAEDSKLTDKELLCLHTIQAVLRRNRAKYTKKDYKDIKELFCQYFGAYKDSIPAALARAVQKSIFQRNEHRKDKYKWDRKLHPAFIHKLLKDELTGTAEA